MKRFKVEPSDRKVDFIGDEDKNKLVLFTTENFPRVQVQFDMKQKIRGTEQEEIVATEFIGVKGLKAKGKRMTIHPVRKINLIENLIEEEPAPVPEAVEDKSFPEKEKPQEPQVIVDKKSKSKKHARLAEPEDDKDEPGTIQMELPL